jgi:hypothetical protein
MCWIVLSCLHVPLLDLLFFLVFFAEGFELGTFGLVIRLPTTRPHVRCELLAIHATELV